MVGGLCLHITSDAYYFHMLEICTWLRCIPNYTACYCCCLLLCRICIFIWEHAATVYCRYIVDCILEAYHLIHVCFIVVLTYPLPSVNMCCIYWGIPKDATSCLCMSSHCFFIWEYASAIFAGDRKNSSYQSCISCNIYRSCLISGTESQSCSATWYVIFFVESLSGLSTIFLYPPQTKF